MTTPRKLPDEKTPTAPEQPTRVVLDALPFDPEDSSLPRGLRLHGVQLDRVRAALATQVSPEAQGPDALLGHALYRANLRAPLFTLQGLARIAGGTGGDKEVFDRVVREVKIIEDLLGDVDYWWVMTEKSKAWELPPEIGLMAQSRHQAACGRLVGWAEARAWIDHRYLPTEGEVALRVHRIGRRLESQSWVSAKKESKRVAGFLLGRVRATERAVQTLDLSKLEEGIHELRRRVRWLSIYAAALDGLLQLDHNAKPPRGYGRYLTPAVVNNPYNSLPKPDGIASPVLLPAPVFYALSWLIAELGVLKDRAQWTETVTHQLDLLGGGGPKAKRFMGELTLDPLEAGKLAAAITHKALFDDKILTRLGDALEAQISTKSTT